MTEPDDDTVPLHEAVGDMTDSELTQTQTVLLSRIDARLELLNENVGRLGSTETAQQPTDADEAQSPSQPPAEDDESTETYAAELQRELEAATGVDWNVDNDPAGYVWFGPDEYLDGNQFAELIQDPEIVEFDAEAVGLQNYVKMDDVATYIEEVLGR